MAGASGRAVLPDQKRDERAGRAAFIAVEEMELAGVLVAARALHQAQAEEAEIEIDIRLHLAGDQGDVVKTARHDRPFLTDTWLFLFDARNW